MRELTAAQALLLQALGTALRGESAAWSEEIPEENWTELVSLSTAHKVLPLVAEAVYTSPAAARYSGMPQLKRMTVGQVMAQSAKTYEFLSLYDTLVARGLHPLVVKGIVCRSLYPNPDHRISGDEDLYVPEGEFEACCEIFRELGMTPGTEDMAAFEIGWRKVGSPLYIELHKHLFGPEDSAYGQLAALFDHSRERIASYTVEGGRQVSSLCPHDHGLYLLLHAYKHFLYSGFGIRQVCDIGMWLARYAGSIDWQRLYDQCSQTRTLIFSAAVMRIAQEYLGIRLELPSNWAAIETDCLPMLKDLLAAGVYGTADLSRQHSAVMTLGAVEAQRGNKRPGIGAALFPPKEKLEGRFPVLKKKPWLLPVMWCVRLAKYGVETAQKDSNTAETLQVAKERIALLRQYKIIE